MSLCNRFDHSLTSLIGSAHTPIERLHSESKVDDCVLIEGTSLNRDSLALVLYCRGIGDASYFVTSNAVRSRELLNS